MVETFYQLNHLKSNENTSSRPGKDTHAIDDLCLLDRYPDHLLVFVREYNAVCNAHFFSGELHCILTAMISPLQESLHSEMDKPFIKKNSGKYFFMVMACVFCIMAVVGFVPSYQAAYNGTFKFHWFVHVHGAIMAAWFGLFFTQTVLVKKGNLGLHRKLGLYSIALGALVWLSMGIVSYRVVIGFPAHVHSLNEVMWPVLWVQVSAMNLFGLFFAWAMRARRDAAAHKRLLYMAMLVLLQAAVGRMTWLPGYGMDHPNVFFLYLDLLLIPLVVYDIINTSHTHRITLIGSAGIIAVQLVTITIF